MPAYNAEETIGASINSVISQTELDWELIVINDCSKDSTAELVSTFAKLDSRIFLYTNENNLGVASARNEGIKRANGQWLAFLDSDDIWHKEKLHKQLQLMHTTGAAISYTSTAYMNHDGVPFGHVLQAKQRLYYNDLLKRNLMSCSSVMVRRDVTPFFVNGDVHEDYVAWLNILQNEKCAYGLDEPLLTYRLAYSSRSGNRLRSAKMIYNAYCHVGYGGVASLLLTLRYSIHSITKRLQIKRS